MLFLLCLPFVLVPGLTDFTLPQTIIAALLLLIIALCQKSRLTITLVDLPWIIFPLLQFVACKPENVWFSENALRLLSLLMIFPIVSNLGNEQKRLFCRGTIVLGLLLLMVQLGGVFCHCSIAEHLAQCSVFSQENVYHSLMFLISVVAAGVVVSDDSGFWRKTALLMVVLWIVSLFTGDYWIGGRLGWSAGDSITIQFTVFMALSFALLLRAIYAYFTNRVIGQIVVVVALIFLIIAPWLLLMYDGWTNNASTSITSRLMLWRSVIDLAKENMLGVGYGQFSERIYDYWPNMNKSLFSTTSYYVAAHNYFLQTLAELGWLGFGGLVFLWVLPIIWCARDFFNTGNNKYLLLTSSAIGWLFSLQFSETTQMFVIPMLASWGLLAFLVSETKPYFRVYNYSSRWFLLLIPIVLALAWDRSWQLRSLSRTTYLEMGGETVYSDIDLIKKALSDHGKNPVALYYVAEWNRQGGRTIESSLAIEKLDEMGELQLSTILWARLYHQMGINDKACCYAWKRLRYLNIDDEPALRQWAGDCSESWKLTQCQ